MPSGALLVAMTSALGAADHPPAATVGDVAELLDVDVDQISGGVVFVTADHPAGATVEVRQTGDAGSAQDGVAGRGGQTEPATDTRWTPPAFRA